MIDFTQDQTLTGEQFVQAWGDHENWAARRCFSMYFVPTSDAKMVDFLVKHSHFILLEGANIIPDDYRGVGDMIRMHKREFRRWLIESKIHTFCFQWNGSRWMHVYQFSSDGEQYWMYDYGQIKRTGKPEDRRDFE